MKIAFDKFEENEWLFENEQACNLAKDTLGALKHIESNVGMAVEKDLSKIEPTIKEKTA